MLAGDELGQIFAALLFVAVAADLVDAEIGMRAVGQSDRSAGARNLLHRHAMLEIAEAGAAILLLYGNAVQAERAHLRPQVCLLYTSDAADDLLCVDLGGRRIIKKKTN